MGHKGSIWDRSFGPARKPQDLSEGALETTREFKMAAAGEREEKNSLEVAVIGAGMSGTCNYTGF